MGGVLLFLLQKNCFIKVDGKVGIPKFSPILERACIYSFLSSSATLRKSHRHVPIQRSRSAKTRPRRLPRGDLLYSLQTHVGSSASLAVCRQRGFHQSEDGVHANSRKQVTDGLSVPGGLDERVSVAEHLGESWLGDQQGRFEGGGGSVGEWWGRAGHSLADGFEDAGSSE